MKKYIIDEHTLRSLLSDAIEYDYITRCGYDDFDDYFSVNKQMLNEVLENHSRKEIDDELKKIDPEYYDDHKDEEDYIEDLKSDCWKDIIIDFELSDLKEWKEGGV